MCCQRKEQMENENEEETNKRIKRSKQGGGDTQRKRKEFPECYLFTYYKIYFTTNNFMSYTFTDLKSGNTIAILLVVVPLALVLESIRSFRDAKARPLVVLPLAHVVLHNTGVQLFVLRVREALHITPCGNYCPFALVLAAVVISSSHTHFAHKITTMIIFHRRRRKLCTLL